MKNHRNNINNEFSYFYKVLKNMDIKQNIKDSKIIYNEITSEDIENILCSEDKYFYGNNLLDWIDLIENIDLHKAIKNLSKEEQILLSYSFCQEKTQSEIAKLYNVTHQSISYKINKIISKIKKHISKK